MPDNNFTTRDLMNMGLAVIFGSAATGFLEASGALQSLADNLGGSMSTAWLVLMIVSGGILVVEW